MTVGGKYTLLRVAGTGGMGVVWAARNEATGGEVAVKVLPQGARLRFDLVRRLRREAYAMARLSHRGIVRAFDLVEGVDGSPFLVLELLRGETLEDRLEGRERLTSREVVRISLDLLAALAHVHERGIVHCDLKPTNVFLAREPDGQVVTKLLDFGVSKCSFDDADVAAAGLVSGTPSYMSPEQALGDVVDARSDVFGMGILLYEMLGGSNPFRGAEQSPMAVVALLDEVTPLDIPSALWRVVARALQGDPAKRFADAADMAEALRCASRPWGAPTWWGRCAAAVRAIGRRRPGAEPAAADASRYSIQSSCSLTPVRRRSRWSSERRENAGERDSEAAPWRAPS